MTHRPMIGLIPAAGRATRIAPLPCSKELYPVTMRWTAAGARPKVVSQYLFESMRAAGIRQAYIILRAGKWDIPTYFNDGTELLDMHLAYLMMHAPNGPPFTLDQAYPFIKDVNVATGFPDIVFWPRDAFGPVIAQLEHTQADIVLGLVPCDTPERFDMVEMDDTGQVIRLRIKQRASGLRYTWFIAVWTPAFTQFMHDYLAELLRTVVTSEAERELHVGDVVQAAIDAQMRVKTVIFPNGGCVDIGAPDVLEQIYKGTLALS